MTTSIKLIATDLDGTLLRSDKTVSERTRAAVRAAQDAGIVMVVATARHPISARLFAEAAGIRGLAVCANGALVYDLAEERVVRHSPMNMDTVRCVIDRLRALDPLTCFAVVQEMAFACEPAYAEIALFEEHGRDLAIVRQADVFDLLDVPATKLIIRHPERTPAEMMLALRALELEGFEATLSGAPFVEMVGLGISKAAALASMCVDLGIAASEVMALGDAQNDIAMLSWAGWPVAPANATPEVLALVRDVTASNDEDGVALAIERVLTEDPRLATA